MMNLEHYKKDYDKYDINQKKETVTTLLSWFLWKWENFDLIYNYITNFPQEVTEKDYDEIFAVIILWLYQEQQEKQQEDLEDFLDAKLSNCNKII